MPHTLRDSPALDKGRPGSTNAPCAGETPATWVQSPNGPPSRIGSPAKRPAPDPGVCDWATVAGYEILGELGRGSMGVVYKARQVALDRLVALKTLQDGAVGREEGLDRFISEARVIARLQHPNIVQVYEISLQRNLPFFAMELVEGGTLAAFLGGRPQPFRDTARLLRTLARAIHAAHEQGIVHRDLKPGNVLLSRRGGSVVARADEGPVSILAFDLKITDFGLAKQLDNDCALTQSGVIMGTPNYMAPEQARGRSRDVGPQADVYALGAILYECLTGRPPHNAESPAETVLMLFQVDPVAPSKLRQKLPRDLETICLKCLDKDPRKRYQSGTELADDLDRYLDGASILARPTPWSEQSWRWLKRHPALAAAAVSAVLLVLMCIGSFTWHHAELREKLVEARLEEQLARDEQELTQNRAKWDRLRGEILGLLQRGEEALNRDDWRAAALPLTRAKDRIAEETEFADLLERWSTLSARAAGQQAEAERLTRFRALRDQALAEATLFTGSDVKSASEQTRHSVRAALAVYGVTPGNSTKPTLESPHLRDGHRREILAACYELLIVLAEATATQGPQHARPALALLDHAESFGLGTRALLQRRASYLALAGDATASLVERRARELPAADVLDHFLLGDELMRKGDVQAAAASFKRVIDEQPGHFWGQCYFALCCLRLKQFQVAEQTLTTCIGTRPDFAWLYLLRGSARGELGHYADAEADYAVAFRHPLDESARYTAHNQRGVLRFREGRLPEAIRDLQSAIALRPRQYQGHLNLGTAFVRVNKLDEALHSLDRAIACEGRLASLYRTRARIRTLRKDDGGALKDLDTALSLDAAGPIEVRAGDHLERARLFLRSKDYTAALAACESALALKPDVRGYRLQTEALLCLGRFRDAGAVLDACLERAPRDVDVLCARAAIRTRLGQYAGAQADYSRALEQAPSAEIYTARAWTYLLTDTPKLALADFTDALRLDEVNADAYVGRGLSRVLIGQTAQGIADAREALRLGPPSSRLSYNAARVFAQAFARDRRSGQRITEDYSRQANDLLATALRQLPAKERAEFWHARILTDPILQPLRSTPEFRRLASLYPVQTVTTY